MKDEKGREMNLDEVRFVLIWICFINKERLLELEGNVTMLWERIIGWGKFFRGFICTGGEDK